MRSGVLFAFPLESVVLRLGLALGVAFLLLRLLAGRDLRSPRARYVLAMSPFMIVSAVVVLSARDLALPALLAPTTAGGALSLPVADRYQDFAPYAASAVIALWVGVVVTACALRLARSRRHRRHLLSGTTSPEPRLSALVVRLSRTLGISPPRVLVAARARGGASVVGVRDPVLLIAARLLDVLDEAELEGVVAHELAHISRRDNLIAWSVAVIRDIVFFVPGARSAVRALHREREAAADQLAATTTGRPAALASGLLRALSEDVAVSSGPRDAPLGCAALVGESDLVERVRLLVDQEPATRVRHRLEVALAVAVSLIAIVVSLAVPSVLSGSAGQRDALGVLLGGPQDQGSSGDRPGGPGRIFEVYARSQPATPSATTGPGVAAPRVQDLVGAADRPGMLEACALGSGACASSPYDRGLALRPAPIVLLESDVARWQATPVLERTPTEAISVYWLARLEPEGDLRR